MLQGTSLGSEHPGPSVFHHQHTTPVESDTPQTLQGPIGNDGSRNETLGASVKPIVAGLGCTKRENHGKINYLLTKSSDPERF